MRAAEQVCAGTDGMNRCKPVQTGVITLQEGRGKRIKPVALIIFAGGGAVL